MNFQSAMQHIPDGSDVIFLLGEIDCREGKQVTLITTHLLITPSHHIFSPHVLIACSCLGLLLAVERDIYPSVTSGMDRVIDIFINDVIKKLIRDRHFRIYIHPVVPVLGDTPLISTLNIQLSNSTIHRETNNHPDLYPNSSHYHQTLHVPLSTNSIDDIVKKLKRLQVYHGWIYLMIY